MVDSKSLGAAVKAARNKAGLTQEEAATKAGISYSTLAKIERGAIASPSFITIAHLAKAYGTSLDRLAGKAKAKAKPTSSDIAFVYADMNGVMVRFFQQAFASIAASTGMTADKIEAVFWHYNDAVNRGDMTLKEFNTALSVRFGAAVDWEKEYMDAVEPITAMHECLKSISKTTKIGLLTNTMPGFVSKMIKSGLMPDLTYAAIVDSSVVGALKPEGRIYEIAEQKAGVSGQQILFIDDSRTNLMAAEKFGWRVLWFDDYRPEESVKRVAQALASA